MKFGGILIALAIVLSGCSGEPAPKEPQKTTSPTPKSTATPPVMPAQAKEDSPEGAAAFVNYWVKSFNYASESGDVEELRRISSQSCEGCQKYVTLIETTYEDGGYFRGGAWTSSKVEVERSSSKALVFVHIDAPPGTQLKEAGGQPGPMSGENSELVFTVKRSSDRQVVTSLVRAAT